MGEIMSGLESVPSAYLSIGFLTVLGIIMPLTNFVITWVVRPRVDPARPHITRSYLLEGYERDHSLYPRRLTTFECGSEPCKLNRRWDRPLSHNAAFGSR